MVIEKVNITKLNPAGYNPRKDLKPGDIEYEKLRRSIDEFGYVEPIIWNKRTGRVVGGHQRLKILAELGYTEIDCVVLDIDEQREKALNVALNKIKGEFDVPLLTDLLKNLGEEGFDVSLTGFEAAEIDELFRDGLPKEVKEDNFDADKAAEEIVTPITQKGDVWILGQHKLMCGDSTSKEDVAKLMDKGTARFIFTDPPWNVDYGGYTHPDYKQRTILNDSMDSKQFAEFLTKAFDNMKAFSETGCMVYIVMSAQEWGNMMNVLENLKFHWSSTIIWKKDHWVISRKDYHTQYEAIWYGWTEGGRLYPLEDRKQSDVWEIPRSKMSEEHPTMKPVTLVAKAIMNSSKTNDIVLDLFGGSGTTLIASQQTGRICRMMELDPKYCDVIVKRFLEQVGGIKDVFLMRNGEKIPYDEAVKSVDE